MINENRRVVEACQALDANDLQLFGTLMYQSHKSLAHDYEVSCKELDFLVDAARQSGHIIGSRMMGGGFGGCTINLVKRAAISRFENEIKSAYKIRFDIDLEMYKVDISEGTHLFHNQLFGN